MRFSDPVSLTNLGSDLTQWLRHLVIATIVITSGVN